MRIASRPRRRGGRHAPNTFFCNDTVIEIEDADGDAMVVDGIRLGFDSFVVDTEAPTVEAYVPTPPAGATGVPVTEAVVVGSARKTPHGSGKNA